jgi:HlyD family secretion protein
LRLREVVSLFLLAGLGCAQAKAPQLETARVSKGSLAEMVSATGVIEAIVTVNVGSQVSGTISDLYVDFNSLVKKGQLLARIDPRPFAAALAKADAGLANAEANVVKAKAALVDAQRVEKRQSELFARALVSQAEVDTATATREQAEAALVGVSAMVKQARADQQQAALNLEYTRIVSPIDGIVISRSIDVGQTVASAFQAPTLFLIANDLTKMRVLANVDEADVGKVQAGQAVRFTVDSFPGERFNGTISQVRHAPNTINNVVTYAAEIAAPNPERKLRQGMTAAVRVTTATRQSALQVPNAALRWKPDDAPAVAAARPDAAGAKGDPAPATDPGSPESERMERVYRMSNGRPEPVTIRLGISDGHHTEVLSGLSEADEVVVGGSYSFGQAGRGPF